MPPIRTLHRTLCITRPILQYLRQLGIHLIIYLDDLLLHTSTSTRLVNSPLVVHSIGVSDQSPKECHTSYPAVGVLGIHGRHSINDHCATIPQGGSNSEGSISIAEATGSADKGTSTLHRYPSGDQTSNTAGASSFSCPSKPENPGPTSRDCHLPIMGADVTRSTERTTMVDNSTATALLSSNPEDSGISGHRIGHIQIGLGGSLSGSAYWRPSELDFHMNYLELKGAFLALQAFVKDKSNIGVLIRKQP